MIPQEVLTQMRGYEAAATPGPWTAEGNWLHFGNGPGHTQIHLDSQQDAALIALMRSWIKDLIEYAEMFSKYEEETRPLLEAIEKSTQLTGEDYATRVGEAETQRQEFERSLAMTSGEGGRVLAEARRLLAQHEKEPEVLEVHAEKIDVETLKMIQAWDDRRSDFNSELPENGGPSADDDISAGRVKRFDDPNDMIESLHDPW